MDLSTFAPAARILLLALFMRFSTMGYFTPQQASELTKNLMDLITLGGPIVYAIWATWKARPAARVASADALPGVAKVIVSDPTLKAAVPSPTVILQANWLATAFALFMVGGMLAGCITTVANADTRLRDKCAYLQSGVALAQIAAGFVPAAGPIVTNGSALIDAYCSGRPIMDAASAMDAMERIIVAIRPIAAKLK